MPAGRLKAANHGDPHRVVEAARKDNADARAAPPLPASSASGRGRSRGANNLAHPNALRP